MDSRSAPLPAAYPSTTPGTLVPQMQNQIPAAPADGPLLDTFGRIADDLRISVTDRCNFRCTYCMPAEGLQWLPKEELLTFEELTRLLALFVGLGVGGLKIPGGDPTIGPTCRRLFGC